MRAYKAESQALTAQRRRGRATPAGETVGGRANAVLKFFQGKVLSAARPKGQEGG